MASRIGSITAAAKGGATTSAISGTPRLPAAPPKPALDMPTSTVAEIASSQKARGRVAACSNMRGGRRSGGSAERDAAKDTGARLEVKEIIGAGGGVEPDGLRRVAAEPLVDDSFHAVVVDAGVAFGRAVEFHL